MASDEEREALIKAVEALGVDASEVLPKPLAIYMSREAATLAEVRRICTQSAANRCLLNPRALLDLIDKLLAEPASEPNANPTGENDREQF